TDIYNGQFTPFKYNIDDVVETKDKSIDTRKRTELGEMGILFSSNPINFDFENGKIVFPSSTSYVLHRNRQYNISGNTTVDIVGNFNSYLYFNANTETLVSRSSPANNERLILLCAMRRDRGYVFGLDNYLINGHETVDNYGKFGVIFGRE